MEVKSYVVIEVVKEGTTYSFSMPQGASYGQARDAAIEVLQQVWAMMAAADQKLQESIAHKKGE